MKLSGWMCVVMATAAAAGCARLDAEARRRALRGIYGGIPEEIVDSGRAFRSMAGPE